MTTDVQVTFGADLSALNAGAAQAKAAIAGVTGQLGQVGQQAQAASGAINAAAATMQSAGHAGHTAGGEMSFFTNELRALADEASSGRWRNFDGSLMRIVGHSAGMISAFVQANPAISAFAAVMAAAAGATLYFGIQAQKSEEQLRQLEAAAAEGQFSGTAQQFGALREQFAALSGESKASATDILASYASIGEGGMQLATALIPYFKALGEAEGKDVGEEAKKLLPRFADLSTVGLKYLESIKSVTAAEREHYQSLVASGQRGDAWVVIMKAMESQLGRVAAETTDAKSKMEALTASMNPLAASADSSVDPLTAMKDAEEAAGRAALDMALRFDQARSSVAALGNQSDATAAQIMADADKIAGALDRVGAESRKLQNDSATMLAGLNKAFSTNDMTRVKEYEDAIKHLHDETLVNNQKSSDPLGINRDAIKQTEDAIKEWQATTGASQDQVHAHAAQVWKSMASDQNLSLEQQHAAYEKYLDQVISGNKEASKAGAKAAKDELGATEEGLKAQIDAIEAKTALEIDKYGIALKTHQISEATKTADTIAALQKERAAVDDLYSHEIALAGLTATKKAEISLQQQQFDVKVTKEIVDAQAKAAEDSAKAWQKGADQIAGIFNSQVDGLLKGTTNFATAFRNMMTSAVEDIIKGLIKWGVEHAATIAANTAASASGVAAQKAINSTAISGDAGRAAAGAYAAVAGVPIIGPVLAPAAAAVAFGAVEAFGSFDTGAWSLPHDMAAIVHQGEMIVPAAQTPWAQSLMTNAASGSGGSGGGTTHVWNVNATDAKSFVSQLRDNSSDLARAVRDAFNSQPSLRPSY